MSGWGTRSDSRTTGNGSNQAPTTLKSAFLTTRPEKTTQLDTGVLWKADGWSGSVSAFYGKIHDYVLIKWIAAPIPDSQRRRHDDRCARRT